MFVVLTNNVSVLLLGDFQVDLYLLFFLIYTLFQNIV